MLAENNSSLLPELLVLFKENIDKGNSLKDSTYHAIKSGILSGKITSEITENQIAETFNISRTPVREAMHQLEMDGLLEITHGKKAIVHNLTQKDVDDISTVLVPLHVLSIVLCIQHITDQQLSEMEETLALIDLYTARKDYEKLRVFNTKFHLQIVNATNNKWLAETLNKLLSLTSIYREYSVSRPSRTEEAKREHHEIFKAIKQHDTDLAKRITIEHVKGAFDARLIEG